MPLEDANGNPIQQASQNVSKLEDADGNLYQAKQVSPTPSKPKYPEPNYDGNAFGDSFSAQNPMRPQDQDTLLSALPIAGGTFGGIPGAAAGSFAKQALSSDPSIGGGVADTFLNGVIPAGIEAGFARGVRGSAAALISKLPQSVIDRIPGVLKSKLTGQLAEQSVPQAASISAKQSADLVSKYTKASTGSFDSAGLLDDLAGPNAAKYKMQFGEQGYKTLKDLADSANSAGVGKTPDSLFSWKEGRKLVIGGAGLHLLGIPPTVSGSVILGADALKKVLGDPKLGALILQATKTGSKAPESSLLMKSAMLGLRGTTLYLTGPDGQKDEVQVSQDQQGNPQLQTAVPKR